MENSEAKREKTIHFRYIFFPFLAFMFGIIVSRQLYRGNIEYILTTIAVILAVIIIMCLSKRFVPLVVMLCLFFVGNGFYYLGALSFDKRVYTEAVQVEGRVSDDIKEGRYGNTILLDNVKVNGRAESKINLYIQGLSTPKVGEVISFTAELTNIKPFTFKSFNSSFYRSGARYNASVKLADIEVKGGYVKFDEKVRLSVKNLLYENMSEKNAGIAYAVLFGDKNEIDTEIVSAYRNSGIIHVLTVSGLHIGFLVAVFYGLLKKCKVNKYVRFVLTTILIIFYAYLCGFAPSVMRAGLMAIVLMLSRLLMRNYDSLNSLGLAGFIICLIKPLSPLDLGFLMSFFCVFSIVTICPVFTKFLSKFLPKKIAGLIALSISAQLGVLPFLAYFGSSVHLLSFLVNLLVVPIFSVLYPYLFVVSMLGALMPFLGFLLFPADLVFKLINGIVIFFDWSNLTLPVSAQFFALVVILFIVMFAMSGYVMTSTLKKFSMIAVSSFLFAVTLGCYHIPSKNYPSAAFISSGSTYSVVLTNSQRQKMVIGYDYYLPRYQSAYNTGSFEMGISLDGRTSEYQVENMTSLGVKTLITYQSMTNNDIVKKVLPGYRLQAGEFVFEYMEYADEVVGLYVLMDNIKIFVAGNDEISYNIASEVQERYNPDYVFAGDYYSGVDNKDYVLTTVLKSGGDYSYQKEGNLMFKFKSGGGYKLKFLD